MKKKDGWYEKIYRNAFDLKDGRLIEEY